MHTPPRTPTLRHPNSPKSGSHSSGEKISLPTSGNHNHGPSTSWSSLAWGVGKGLFFTILVFQMLVVQWMLLSKTNISLLLGGLSSNSLPYGAAPVLLESPAATTPAVAEDAPPPPEPISTGRLQLDVMVPVFERDERLRQFAIDLGQAIAAYRQKHEPSIEAGNNRSNATIGTFRLLVTRFSSEEKATAVKLQRVLAALTDLPLANIVMIASDDGIFSRARALNLLHGAACQAEHCMVSRLDVDMLVTDEFFNHAVQAVILQETPPDDAYNGAWQTGLQNFYRKYGVNATHYPTAYFPIVWSAYNPQTVQLVEEACRQLNRPVPPPFSEHRGHWREYGKGMYVIWGPDAAELGFDTKFEGWGMEDTDFFQRTVAMPRRIIRRMEPGLVHTWHPKDCPADNAHLQKCRASIRFQEGSKWGKELLHMFRERVKQS